MKHSLLYCLLIFSVTFCFGQRSPATDATQVTPTLAFSTSITNASSVVFNPNFNLYYIIRSGNSTYPLETLSSTGAPVYQTDAGLDSRGMWWNPNTNEVERNCYSNIGWATVDLDATGDALDTYSIIFSGQLQPDIQSVGAYDYKTDKVLFYNGGSTIYIYDRSTGSEETSLTLSGADFTNINSNTVIYTGENGYEIGLLDYVNKIVLLFDRSTGAFTGQSQLPSDAITNNLFRFSYSNFRVWLNDISTATWYSYNIWNEALPVTLLSFKGYRKENNVVLTWQTTNEINNSYFEVERSDNSKTFTSIGTVKGTNAANGSNYSFTDIQPLKRMNYYRLKQVDKDGKFTYSGVVSANFTGNAFVAAYPNPATKSINIIIPQSNTVSEINIYNMAGKQVAHSYVAANTTVERLNVNSLAPGVYNIILIQGSNRSSAKFIKN